MNFSWWTFALQAANFLILIWLLQRFLFKPVKEMVARRKQEIARVLTEASQEKKSAELIKLEIESKRSEIDQERHRIVDQAREQLSAERTRMLEEVRVETAKIREQALKQIAEERASASDQLFEHTVALAKGLAERLLRELDLPSMEQPFLARVINYIDQLAPEERAKLVSRFDGAALLVTTAHPLDVQQQSKWREQLSERLGAGFQIEFNADPALIVGAVISFPHGILRFNWRDSLNAAVKELHADK